MAFVVARRGGVFEIRESTVTTAGPRARTLASFRALTDEVLERARQAAARPFDTAQVRAAATRAGAPIGESSADQAARALLFELASGRSPSPALRRLVVDGLTRSGPLPELEASATAEWATANLTERGQVLLDLLHLADRLPPTRRDRLRFPRLVGRTETQV